MHFLAIFGALFCNECNYHKQTGRFLWNEHTNNAQIYILYSLFSY